MIFSARGIVGCTIGLEKLLSIINMDAPSDIATVPINLQFMHLDMQVKRVSEIRIADVVADKALLSVDVRMSGMQEGWLANVVLDGTITVYINLSFNSTEKLLSLSYFSHRWIVPIKLQPLNVEKIFATKINQKLESELSKAILSLSSYVNRDVQKRIDDAIQQLPDNIAYHGSKLTIDIQKCNRYFSEEQLHIQLQDILVDKSCNEVHSLVVHAYESCINDNALSPSHMFIQLRIPFDLLAEKLGEISLPSHTYRLEKFKPSEKYIKLKFKGLQGIVGNFSIKMELSLTKEHLPHLRVIEIKFKKKLIKFFTQFNWFKDLLLQKVQKKVTDALNEIMHQELNQKSILKKIEIENISTHSLLDELSTQLEITFPPINLSSMIQPLSKPF